MAAGTSLKEGGLPTYADRLKTNVKFDQRLKRNILEIFIEKSDEETELVLNQNVVARLMDSLKMNTATEMEGFQIKYTKNGAVIQVWCVQGVNIEKFCRQENIQVSRGVFARSIRPAGRRDVTVTVTGLNWNTPDSLVIEYLKKFGGQMVTDEVIYGKYGEGPLRGKKNGDRKYQVIFDGVQMGTFHFLDGERVKIFYRGNMKTCGYCQKTADSCPGGGLAKDCKENGGQRLDLAKHMKDIWEKIGFLPSQFELPESMDDEDMENDKCIKEGENFNPPIQRPDLKKEDIEKITGFEIRNFPAARSNEEVKVFIQNKLGYNLENIEFSRKKEKLSATVSTENKIHGSKILEAVDKIQYVTCKEKFFGNPLYCRIFKDLTPSKQQETETSETPAKTENKSPKNKNTSTPVLSCGSVTGKMNKRNHENVLSSGSAEKSPKEKRVKQKPNLK